jgi:hypothetical protein
LRFFGGLDDQQDEAPQQAPRRCSESIAVGNRCLGAGSWTYDPQCNATSVLCSSNSPIGRVSAHATVREVKEDEEKVLKELRLLDGLNNQQDEALQQAPRRSYESIAVGDRSLGAGSWTYNHQCNVTSVRVTALAKAAKDLDSALAFARITAHTTVCATANETADAALDADPTSKDITAASAIDEADFQSLALGRHSCEYASRIGSGSEKGMQGLQAKIRAMYGSAHLPYKPLHERLDSRLSDLKAWVQQLYPVVQKEIQDPHKQIREDVQDIRNLQQESHQGRKSNPCDSKRHHRLPLKNR